MHSSKLKHLGVCKKKFRAHTGKGSGNDKFVKNFLNRAHNIEYVAKGIFLNDGSILDFSKQDHMVDNMSG